MQQHYVGEVGKSNNFCVALIRQILWKSVNICRHYSKMNSRLFFTDAVDENERAVEEAGSSTQSSPVVLVSVQHALTADAEDDDDNATCENSERRTRSSSSSSSQSSHSHHSSHIAAERSDEPTHIATITTSPSVDEQRSQRLSEPETPSEHSKCSV